MLVDNDAIKVEGQKLEDRNSLKIMAIKDQHMNDTFSFMYPD